ncbi:hypothetical protein GE09DRAFT_358522 [Coniochaeta sp. 2T2.1]|nr:hypothetical protein GE09DRAFT_358522 [Coniochaeta sp. 2T2.1]
MERRGKQKAAVCRLFDQYLSSPFYPNPSPFIPKAQVEKCTCGPCLISPQLSLFCSNDVQARSTAATNPSFSHATKQVLAPPIKPRYTEASTSAPVPTIRLDPTTCCLVHTYLLCFVCLVWNGLWECWRCYMTSPMTFNVLLRYRALFLACVVCRVSYRVSRDR